MLQIPIGIEDQLAGVVDLVHEVVYNDGENGEVIREEDCRVVSVPRSTEKFYSTLHLCFLMI